MKVRFILTSLRTCALILGGMFAATVALAGPGSALQFDGGTNYVQGSTSSLLNAYPITVTCWFRSTNTTIPVQGLVSKYIDGTGNGWFLVIQGNQLRGYYSKTAGDVAVDKNVGPVVTDGYWHQAALVVDAFGGKVYLDGALLGTNIWQGTPGASTSGNPLYIGRYQPTAIYNSMQGQVDEVTVWNRALGSGELNNLKYRQLNGNEDGLVALYHLDEGMSNTTADATTNHLDASLVFNPLWTNSTAPLVFNPVAGGALKFNGGTDYVSIPSDATLNTYPLTLMTWIRTSVSNASANGVISKYADNTFNGYSMFLLNGHIHAWYFRDSSDFVWDHGEGLDGGFIADGQWHHLAFVVDTFGGHLYVDGVQTTQLAWSGSPGPTTSPLALQVGRYSTANSIPAVMDEVSAWNVALTPAQIAAYKNTPLTGGENGLLSALRFNEGSGTNAADPSPYGHNGLVANNPTWVGSTAFLGDGTTAVHSTLGAVHWANQFLVQTIPAKSAFTAVAPFAIKRLDDFGASPAPVSAQVSLPVDLESAANGTVPLVNGVGGPFNFTLQPYLAAAPQTTNGAIIQTPTVSIQPPSGTVLASVSDTFQLTVTENLSTNGNPPQFADSSTLASTHLLDFDGNLYFGSALTTFTSIANTPARGALDNGGVDSILSVNNQSGVVVNSPNHTYGSGSAINVILQDNGDAFAGTGTFIFLNSPTPDTDCLQGLCFRRTNTVLTVNGPTAGLYLLYPAGFSTTFSTNSRLTDGFFFFSSGATLDGSLRPTSSLTTTSIVWAVEETKPFRMKANNLTWNPTAGQITFNIGAIQFIRQFEDDALTGIQAQLNDPNTANRISNDGYFRNAGINASSALLTADANGVAQLTTSVTLNPPELRPHFPYASILPGSQINTAPGGQMVYTNGIIDLPNSSLPIVGSLPVSYSTDCSDTNCSGASGGPITLAFTPDGNAALNFTRDGGLLSYGSVPDTTLTWGYNGTGHYAQSAGDVQTTVFEMAGTFLRADQTSITAAQRPFVMLGTGFGDATNASYIERYGQTNYPAGFANYPGLNFRAPRTGESFLAGADTGAYPLMNNSKYYVRAGGVSGIHQAAPFTGPLKLSLYGYPFTFTSYALSFLDSDNDQSRTDGALDLPFPSAFTQEFSRMKFVCSGGLDSAEVPATSGTKHLAYWNADIKPLSVLFAQPTNQDCSTAQSFLVLGVQTSLPFIPQTFHATLGFKSNGNLLTLADGIKGVNSRFAVPGQLNLQGPGTSLFPLAAASDAYFNNWENPSAPAAGFFTFAGKLRTPFFGDVKVHLLITPPQGGGTNPAVAIAGGWPSPDGNGQNTGWNVGTANYFNTTSFDPQQYGFPIAAGSPELYTKSKSEQYRPRAQRDWIEVAQFDYPLQWDGVLRQFKGFADGKVQLPVIEVDSSLKQLSPGRVDFDFAQDLSLKLPSLRSVDFINNAVNEVNGPLTTMSNALRQVFGQGLNESGLTSGFQDLQKILNEDTTAFFQPLLQPVLSGVVNSLYSNLLNSAAANVNNKQAFLDSIPTIVGQFNSDLTDAIQQINGAAGQANSVFGQINSTLNDVDDTLGLLERALDKDSDGNRHTVQILIQKLIQDQSDSLKIVGDLSANLSDAALQEVTAEIDPTLDEIQDDLTSVKADFDELKTDITSGTGDLSSTLNSITAQTGMLQQYVQQATTDLSNVLAQVATPEMDYFASNPAAAKKAISDSLITSFIGSAIPGSYKQTFCGFFSDKNFLLDQLMDATFDQINNAIRQDLENIIAGSEDDTFKKLLGAGLLGQSLLSAKLKGQPTFNGDSLRKIHLDANFKLLIPDEMSFDAYLEVNELDSESTGIGCIPPGAPAAEVTLGVKHVPLQWKGVNDSGGSSPLFLDADARWTLQNGAVLGIGGTIDITGQANFEGCGIKDVGASFAAGEQENYFAARAAATVVIGFLPVDFKAGFFAGHACSLDPLIYVDPDVTNALPNVSTFTGVYIQYGGSLSLSKAILGEADCALDVECNIATQQYFYGGPSSLTIGYRQKQGLDVSLLCCLSGSAEFTMGASGTIGPDGPILDLAGSADFCASAGPCPLCAKGCKTFGVMGELNKRGLDYSFQY